MLVFSTDNPAKTMLSNAADNAIMTTKGVADYLNHIERTIYRLAGVKQTTAYKVGGSWRYSKVDIDRRIREQSSSASDEKRD
jgi:excisionase family DNA binding protein